MNQLEHHLDLGPAHLFPLAREAVLTWALQESAGVRVRPARRVRHGQVVGLRLNPLWPASPRRLHGRDLTVPVGSCVVIRVVDEADRAGFTYRTLPGHVEEGEETFLVSTGSDGRLGVTITAESVPVHPLLKAAGPVAVMGQSMMARRYAEELRRLLAGSACRPGRALRGGRPLLGEALHL